MAGNQSWGACRYAVGSGGGDEMDYEIRQHGLFESYNCENKKVIRTGLFPEERMFGEDRKTLVDVAHLAGVRIADDITDEMAKEIGERIQRDLRMCLTCNFYKSKREAHK